MESFEKFNNLEQLDAAKIFRFRMDLQRWLIRENCKPGEDIDEHLDNWLRNDAEDFAQIFEELENEPEIMIDYINRWGESDGVETESLVAERAKIMKDINTAMNSVKQEKVREKAA